MGIESQKSPRYFRDRAEEFRARAEQAERHETKNTMREVAKRYDEFAGRTEQMQLTKRSNISTAKVHF